VVSLIEFYPSFLSSREKANENAEKLINPWGKLKCIWGINVLSTHLTGKIPKCLNDFPTTGMRLSN